MAGRAAGARRRPSQAISAALIFFGFALAALWMALPRRTQDPEPAPFMMPEGGADPGRAEAAAREIAARGDEGLAELVPALAHGTFADGEAVDEAARAILEAALSRMDPRALVSFLEATAP